MKKTMVIAILLLYSHIACASHANKFWMKRPVSTWQNYTAGLSNVNIDVTPMGTFAQVDLTFSIGPTTNPSPTDSQEAVIFFDLPTNSYLHDSWLWLDSTYVSQAQLYERKKAVEVYTGIVKRRKDPSILYNSFSEGYQFNIYPVTTNFCRKVKISYSTPIIFRNGNAIVPLPTDLLAASPTPPPFKLNVHTNGSYDNPSFAGRPFGSWLVNQSGNTYAVNVPGGVYAVSDLNLVFQVMHPSGSILTVMPTASNEGYYELLTVPQTTAPGPKYYNIIIDHKSGGNNDLYSIGELQRSLHGWLTTTLRSTDYFNIHYRKASGVVSLFSGWHLADSAGTNSIAPAFSGVASANEADYMTLLVAGMNFTKGTPGAETIVLNGNMPSTASSQSSLFNLVKAGVVSFSNKLHVVDYHYSTVTGTGAPYFYGSTVLHGLLSQLADSTKGSYQAPRTVLYDNYTTSYMYDLNLKDALAAIAESGITSTSGFQIDIPVIGFTYGEYVTNKSGKFSPAGIYTETGHYYGTFPTNDNVTFSYKIAGAYGTMTSPLTVVTAAYNQNKTWNYFNNRNLIASGASFRQEVIDSSINNRVLSDYTAFLALDLRDTINKSPLLNVNNPSVSQSSTLKVYPNPFRSVLTIESDKPIESVQIYSFDGKLVKSVKTSNVLKWTWDGKDNSGASLPAGIYVIRVATSDHSDAIKVSKLD